MLIGALHISLFIHVALMLVVIWRLFRGQNAIDRLMAADLAATLTLSILVLAALIHSHTVYIDVALGLAALGFVSVVAYAKFLTDRKIF